MSEKFSPTLRIGDLSDFIAPSQACVVSLKGLKATPNKPEPQVLVLLALLRFLSSIINLLFRTFAKFDAKLDARISFWFVIWYFDISFSCRTEALFY